MWHTAALIGAVLALGGWIAFCLVLQPPRIEETLQLGAERALATTDLGDVRVAVSGRDATLEGLAVSPAALAEAELLVAGVAGVRAVDNLLAVREAEPVPVTHLEIRVGTAGLSLIGAVPSEALRLEVVDRARQLFGDDRVDARLIVDAAVPDGAALAAAASVLSAVAEAGGVRARLAGDSLRLSGTVASVEQRRRIEQQARAAAPGVRLFFSALAVNAGGPDEGGGS